MTFQASNILKHLKVLVPQAMSIITCESDSVSDTLPEASHVKLPYEEVGQVAAKRLLHLTACPDEKPRQITVVPRLIIGTTCAPLSPSNEKPELL
jgi:DNA-binding LacI/PurR family transcriptional regulator